MPADSSAPAVFLSTFQKLVPTHLETPWTAEDGLGAGELEALLEASPAAEAAREAVGESDGESDGVPIPLSLYEFHRALGNCPDLLETDHFFFDADELEIRDGFLMFLEDAGESTVWGLPVADAELPDPLVWRRSTGADAEHGVWTCEGGTFSEFAVDLLAWTFEDSEDPESPGDE
ncbi:hypothetical protein ACFFIO_11485 [Citricoccus parietis]|uniref:Knr4/Smi1-like domain-containing protein n=1 Tax=Citricoccus parietis TaxID=592307 RepID=A0ABV6F6H2_9MICC